MLLRLGRLTAIVIVLLAGLGSSVSVFAETYSLTESASDERVFSVSSQVTIDGQFETPGTEGKSSSWAAKSVANYRFRSRRLPGAGRDAAALRTARFYEQASARITIDKTVTTPRLHPQVSLLVAQGREDGVLLFSPAMLLRRDDVDLLNGPGDSLSLLALLPRTGVELGEKWNADTWAIQMFADVDAVLKASIVCELRSAESGVAIVGFSGDVEGASAGAPTKITLSGNYEYDLEQKFIRRLKLTQTEDRKVGAVSPGMKVKAEVSLSRSPSSNRKGLEDATLAALPLEPQNGQTLLVYDSPWQVRFLHDRGWHLFHKTDKLAILRLLDQGRLVSQCNLTSIAAAAPGEHTSEEQFQADIRSSLGDRLVEIVGAEQLKSGPADKRFIYRVTAKGKANNRELRWIYYLVAAPSGRQVSFVFAVDEGDVASLKERDVAIVTSVEFLKPQQPATATP